jgi:peptidase E
MNETRLFGFFSGFDPSRGFPSNVECFLREKLSQRETLVFIASNPVGHTKTDHYAAVTHGWFEAAGLSFACYHVIDDRTEPAHAAQLISEASCVFLMGGKTGMQMAFLRETGLAQAIQCSSAAIFGLSAGAINMGAVSLDIDESLEPHEGLALADITIHPHFDPQNRDELSTLLRLSAQFPIYAMRDDSAIFVQNNQNSFMGEIIKL